VNLRGTFALLAALVALGAYVWLVEIRGEEKKKETEAAEKRVLALAPAKVTALELDTSDGPRAKLVRAGANEWKLEAPVAYPADASTVDSALQALEKLQSTATIAERPADLEPFGLGATRKTITAHTGDTTQTLALGGPTPVGGGRYVEVGTDPPRLFTVSAGSLASLEPSLRDLRDRRILRLGADGADEVAVRSGGALVARAKKDDDGWQLVEPETAPADGERIRRMLDDLALARASEFEDEPKDLASYGLAKPAVELEVRAAGAVEKLAIGEADGKTWVQRAGDPVLLEANERVRTSVPTAFFDLRQKRVLTLDAEQVHAVEIAFPRTNETHRVTRDGEAWKSGEEGVELKPLAAEDLVYALADLDATGVEDSSPDRKQIGLEPPAVVFRALDAKGGALGELSIGDADVAKGLPALSSQSPGVWRIANELGRQAPLSPEAWKNLFVKGAEPAEAEQPADAPAPSSP
jgi:hypothetical protein